MAELPHHLLVGTDRGLLEWPDRWLIRDVPIWGICEPRAGTMLAAGWDGGGIWRVSGGQVEQVLEGTFRLFSISPEDPDRVLAGAMPVDVFRSNDAGRTWTAVTAFRDATPERFPEDHYVRGLAFAPYDPEVIYAGVEGLGTGGVLRSDDGGDTWRFTALTRDIHGLVCPGPPDTVYASSGYGFFATTDGGESWQERAAGLEQSYPMALARTPDGLLVLGVAEKPPPYWRGRPEGAEAALYVSSDDGVEWRQVLPPGVTAFNAIATASDDTIYAGRADGSLYVGNGDDFEEAGRAPAGVLSLWVPTIAAEC